VITLVRPNGHPVIVNVDLIETVERDGAQLTVVTLTTGNVLQIADAPESVLEAVVAYRQRIGGRT